MASTIRPTDDDARRLAQDLIRSARFGALGVIDPETLAPMVSRIGLVLGPDHLPLALVSDLAHHTRALKVNPACSILLGEPGAKGDPLIWPRLAVQGHAAFVRHGDPRHRELCAHYLELSPKAALYIGFGDFSFLQIVPRVAHLNSGFGKAFILEISDLVP